MTYELRPLTAEQGEEMAQWRYPGPWAIYDVTGPLDPAEGFWSVLDGSGDVVGYACFGFEARVPGLEERPGVLDVGVGMRPDLTGQGRGREFSRGSAGPRPCRVGDRAAPGRGAGLERPQPPTAVGSRLRGDGDARRGRRDLCGV